MTADDNAALIIRPDQTEWTPEQLKVIQELSKDKFDNVVDPEDPVLTLFLHKCQRTKLDPFSAQIYLVNKGAKYSIQTGIDGYRIIAQRTGEYAGQDGPYWCGPNRTFYDVWLDIKEPAAAKVGVYRKGFAAPLYGVATWKSYGGYQSVWKKMPDIMLAKCAEALALRKAFPADLAGIYTAEEMAQSEYEGALHLEEITPVQADAEQSAALAESGRARVQQIAADLAEGAIDGTKAAALRTELLSLYRAVEGAGVDTAPFNDEMTLLEAIKHFGGEMKKIADGGSVTVAAPAYPWSSLSIDQSPDEWVRYIDKIVSEQELHDLTAHAKRVGILPALEGAIAQAREDLKAPLPSEAA